MPVFSPATAEEAALGKRLENATVLRTFDTKGAYIRHFDVANNVIAFTLEKNDSVFVTVCDIDGKELSHFGQAVDSDARIEGAEFSPDGNILIIHKYHGGESMSQAVYNVDGTLLFEKPYPALLPSPNGKYFCNKFNEIQAGLLTLFDSLGNEISIFANPRFGNCRFLGDDRLLVVSPDTAWVISTATAHIMRTFPHRLIFHDWPSMPRISLSSFDSSIAIYTDKSLLLLSCDFTEKWRFNFDEFLYTVLFNDQNSWMALVFTIPGERLGVLRIISTSNPGIAVESDHLSALGRNAIRYFDVSWFSDQTISIWGPVSSSLWRLREDVDYWTMFFDFDIESHVLGQPSKLLGLLRLISTDQNQQKYLRCVPNTGATILSIEEDKKKTER
jgi:hypothetical protein